MLDAVMDAVVAALRSAGIRCFRAFPETEKDLPDGAGVSLGIDSYKVLSAGMGDYIGMRAAAGGSDETALFGKRVDLTLGLEVFAPFGGKSGSSLCTETMDRLRNALSTMPEGMKALEMDCGEVKADEELGTYRCRCQVKCLAFLVAESEGDTPVFTDFRLKGTVKNGNQ